MSWRINNWCSDPNNDPKNHHLACVYIIDVWIKVMTEWYLSVSLRDARFILTGKSGEWEHVDIRGSFVRNSTDTCTRNTWKLDPFLSFQNGTNNIQLRSQLSSWCIYRFGVLFLMWRIWHLCSHLHIVQCAFSGHSRVPAGETSRLAVIPADTRAQGISHIPFNDKLWYKNRKNSQGSQMETSLTDGSRGGWCIHMSYSSLFSIIRGMIVTLKARKASL